MPVAAIGLGVLGLGKRLQPQQFAGMVLIGFALALLDGRLARFLRLAK